MTCLFAKGDNCGIADFLNLFSSELLDLDMICLNVFARKCAKVSDLVHGPLIHLTNTMTFRSVSLTLCAITSLCRLF